MSRHSQLLDRYYRSVPGWTDGTTEFHALCQREIAADANVIEIGSGPSNPTSRFLAGICARLDGMDIDASGDTNDALTSFYHGADGTIPVPDGSYDTVVSNFVLEHVEAPEVHLAEVRRVLRPGGKYLFRTPNLHHYVALISAGTPQWFHRLIANRARRLSSETHEPWPTVYLMNTRRSIELLSRRSGFYLEELRLVEKEPSYLAFAAPLFLAGVAYERLVNSTPALARFRSTIFAILRRGE